jgi:hypothetical protein
MSTCIASDPDPVANVRFRICNTDTQSLKCNSNRYSGGYSILRKKNDKYHSVKMKYYRDIVSLKSFDQMVGT